MARVEIEERAWSDSKLKRLAKGLRISRSYAMGLLTTLWHDSQNEGKYHATEDDLLIWYADDLPFVPELVGMLQASGYLEKTEKGTYKIDGNRKALAKVSAYKNRAKAAADHRWKLAANLEKALKKQDVNATSKRHATSMLEEQFRDDTKQCLQHDSMTTRQHDNTENISLLRNERSDFALANRSSNEGQKRSSQLDVADSSCDQAVLDLQAAADKQDARQTNKTASGIDATGVGRVKRAPRPKNASEPKPARLDGVNDFIGHFVTCWAQSHPDSSGAYPVEGKDAAAAKRIVKAVGRERAMELVTVYLGMKTSWLVARRHPIWAMVNDLPALIDYAGSGKLITTQGARKIEIGAAGDALIDRMLRRDQDKLRKEQEKVKDEANTIDVQSGKVSNADW